jgi:hypothetical protein
MCALVIAFSGGQDVTLSSGFHFLNNAFAIEVVIRRMGNGGVFHIVLLHKVSVHARRALTTSLNMDDASDIYPSSKPEIQTFVLLFETRLVNLLAPDDEVIYNCGGLQHCCLENTHFQFQRIDVLANNG